MKPILLSLPLLFLVACDPEVQHFPSPSTSSGGGERSVPILPAGAGGFGPGAGGGGLGGSSQGSGGASEGSGGAAGGGGPCSCKEAGDVCLPERGTCGREDDTCNAVTACPDGYDCKDGGVCVCADAGACGIDCSTNGDCPEPWVCDPAYGTCRPELGCLRDADCDGGQRCLGKKGDHEKLTCIPGGTLAEGTACNRHRDCASGVCAGVCLHACTANADCPGNLRCGGAYDPLRLGCMLAAETDCGSSCSAPGDACASPYPGCVENCTKTSDCAVGDCRITMDAPQDSFCDDSEPACDGQEFALWGNRPEKACFVYEACWTDANCAGPHTCIVPLDSDGFHKVSNTGFCGRKL